MHAAGGITGARIVRNFLSSWERGTADEVLGSRFATIVEAVASSLRAADALREFLEERVWSRVREPPRNRALIAAQLFGLAWTRCIRRVEPVASADPEDRARWVGATIDTLLESRPRAEPDDPV